MRDLMRFPKVRPDLEVTTQKPQLHLLVDPE